MSGVDLSEFVSGFLAEADELVQTLRETLLALDVSAKERSANPRAVRDAYRALHTMKGLAAMVGVEPIVELSHAMETSLREADRRGGWLPGAAIEPLLEGLGAVSARLSALGAGTRVPAAPKGLLEKLSTAGIDAEPAPNAGAALSLGSPLREKLGASELTQLVQALNEGKRVRHLVFRPSEERAAAGMTITSVRARVGALGEIVKTVPLSKAPGEDGPSLRFALVVISDATSDALAEAVGSGPEAVVEVELTLPKDEPIEAESSSPEVSAARNVLRVDVRRVDDAVDRLSRLHTTRFRLERAIDELSVSGVDVRALRQLAEDTTRQLRDARRAVLAIRMMTVKELLDPLPLLVRGVSAATKKPLSLDVVVGAEEIDKGVAESLWTAVVHLVRNAVDHGIEAETSRTAAGKPAQGQLTVRCAPRGTTHVEISVEDDGRGIDAARLAARANVPVPTSEAALLELLARPGLSSRDDVTATSGRGLGVDIVKRIVVDRLGGELRVRTVPGRGTAFVLRVPVTLAIADAFRFACGEDAFLVPVSSVEELVEVEPTKLASGPSPKATTGTVGVLSRRGRSIPIVDLYSLFVQPRSVRCPKAIVIRKDDELFAFGVDRLLGRHEVVVRPLRDPLVKARGVTGASDLGDGRPTLVLDLAALTASFERESAA